MTSIEKGQAWLKRVGRAGMAIAPLALVVASAHAAVVFSPNVSGSGPCEQLPAGQNAPNGVTGVKCYGQVSSFEPTFSIFGFGSGVFDESSIPFEYDFTVFEEGFRNDAVELSDWEGNITVRVNSLETNHSVSGLFGQPVTGSFNVAVPNGEELSSWSIFLSACAANCKTKITIDVPKNSLDLNRGSIAAVPEPGTVALLAGGLIVLGLRRRKA